MRSINVISFILFSLAVSAGGRFEYSANCIEAGREIFSLKLASGKAILDKEKTANPGNLIVQLLEDDIDFFTILIDEKRTELEAWESRKTKRLDEIEKGDQSSPWYNYCQAEIYLHWGINRMKFGQYLKGASEVHEAYKLLESNIKKFPNFLPNKKSMGMLEAIMGTVPENYQWIVSIIGMDGDIDAGIAKIEKVVNSTGTENYLPLLRQEAVFIYAYLQLYVLKNPAKAWALIDKNTTDYKTNELSCFIRANIALRSKKTDIAIQTLADRPKGAAFHPLHQLDYIMGCAKLYRGDDDAYNYFKKYVAFYTGENQVKAAYVKLAWHYYLRADVANYNVYRTLALQYGHENIEEDKQAKKDAESQETPDATILRARMYFDGGYYIKALAEINKKKESDYPDIKLQLEYTYRKARILHEMGKKDDAERLYKSAIDKGRDLPYYFAANSSLQLGIINEEKGYYETARNWYEQCFKFPNKEYRNSIQQKAKAGLKRIEGK